MRWLFLLPIFLFAETHFLLIRHGQTDWNLENRMQGISDNPLNAKGLAQAEVLSQNLLEHHGDVSAIYSSDLKRAYSTAEALARKFAIPVVCSAAFCEYDWGDLEGMNISQLFARYEGKAGWLKATCPDRRERWGRTIYPHAETYNRLLVRFRDQLLEIAHEHPGEKVAIFTHMRAMRTMMADVMDEEVDPLETLPNCAVVNLYYAPEARTFRVGEIESYISD